MLCIIVKFHSLRLECIVRHLGANALKMLIYVFDKTSIRHSIHGNFIIKNYIKF